MANYSAGEDRHGARLTNNEIKLMRQMHEEFPAGHAKHLGYKRLAQIFECHTTTAQNICTYRARGAP